MAQGKPCVKCTKRTIKETCINISFTGWNIRPVKKTVGTRPLVKGILIVMGPYPVLLVIILPIMITL